MSRELKRMLVIVMVLGSWLVLFQNIDIAGAGDPDYPTKPIDFYISIGAGGSTDLACRAIIDAASKHLGQSFTPINKVGASGAIAAMTIKTAKPDGYTIGACTPSTIFIVPFKEGAKYDYADFTWIQNFGSYVFPLVVRGDSPWQTWDELIAWARKNPRGVKIAISGARFLDYKGLVLWQIEQKENVEFTYLTYKGTHDAQGALLGGHISIMAMSIIPTTRSYLETGKLRILAYLGKNKAPGYENLPAANEVYGFGIPDFLAVYGPKGLPDYAVRKLDRAFSKAVKEPSFIKAMNRMNMPIVYMDHDTLTKYLAETFSKTAKLIEQVKAEEARKKK